MTIFFKGTTGLVGVLFLLIGLAGLLTPQDFAASLKLSLDNPEGAGSVRAMIGAHYVAMGSVCLFASFRARPGLLWPVAAIEIAMVFARLLSAVNGEFGASALIPTVIEILASVLLVLAATNQGRAGSSRTEGQE